MLTFYRILSYILLPVGLLLGLLTLAGLLLSLGNIAALLPVFMVGATVIYIFASFMFLNRVIDGHQQVRASLRDWVRVNAFVALFFAISTIMQSVALMRNPQLVNEVMEQAQKVQQVAMPRELLVKTMRAVFYALLVVGGILAIHVTMTLRWLKLYQNWFQK